MPSDLRIRCECYDATGLCYYGADQDCRTCAGTGWLDVSIDGDELIVGAWSLTRGAGATRSSATAISCADNIYSARAIEEWVSPEMARVIELSETPAAAQMVAVAL